MLGILLGASLGNLGRMHVYNESYICKDYRLAILSRRHSAEFIQLYSKGNNFAYQGKTLFRRII